MSNQQPSCGSLPTPVINKCGSSHGGAVLILSSDPCFGYLPLKWCSQQTYDVQNHLCVSDWRGHGNHQTRPRARKAVLGQSTSETVCMRQENRGHPNMNRASLSLSQPTGAPKNTPGTGAVGLDGSRLRESGAKVFSACASLACRGQNA